MNLKRHCQPNNNDRKMDDTALKFDKLKHTYIPGICPLSQTLALLQAYISQSCGKCVPCRDGLKQAETILKSIIEFKANEDSLKSLKDLLTTINQTADCAVGYGAANTILASLDLFKDEYELHVFEKKCSSYNLDCAPCVSYCPANVDIPGYISLIQQNRCDDAVRLIRKDNPFVCACAYVCEHPCEMKCRRNILDDAINIRALKRYAIDHSMRIDNPKSNVETGKKINIVGAGPAGLTCAYYLALMGHKVQIYEAHKKLGGMLQYGIPNYRLPKTELKRDIDMIIKHKNITVKTGVKVGSDISFKKLKDNCDALFVAIGCQVGKKIRLSGTTSAVEMLGLIGDGKLPNYKGKNVVVIGGGNVAMDAARSAVRCNAKSVTVVYRRRQCDMTALDAEIQGAIEEGVEIKTLCAPKKIKNKTLIATPQMVSVFDKSGRPKVVAANKDDIEIKCDVALLAIGQDVAQDFSKYMDDKVFFGGDCDYGPSTVIKAVAAGKETAVQIDEYLGYHHKFGEIIDIPDANPNCRDLIGRSEISTVAADKRIKNFKPIEIGLSEEEAMQECKKCLRCDVYGCNHVD
ncbi:MAG: FAD-dependent oxidoreductase [Coriobacteriia bacterium]|nr:FAD-dependent oxidoreductase [Coriobacteriia bacterium]